MLQSTYPCSTPWSGKFFRLLTLVSRGYMKYFCSEMSLPLSASLRCTFRQTFGVKLLLSPGAESTNILIGKPSPAVDRYRTSPGASKDLVVVGERVSNLGEFLLYLIYYQLAPTSITLSAIKEEHKQSKTLR